MSFPQWEKKSKAGQWGQAPNPHLFGPFATQNNKGSQFLAALLSDHVRCIVHHWFIRVVPLTMKSRFLNNVFNSESNFRFLTAEADISPAYFLSQLLLVFMVKGIINLMLCGSRYKDLLSREKFCIPPVWHLQSASLTLWAMHAPFAFGCLYGTTEERKAFLLLGKG